MTPLERLSEDHLCSSVYESVSRRGREREVSFRKQNTLYIIKKQLKAGELTVHLKASEYGEYGSEHDPNMLLIYT